MTSPAGWPAAGSSLIGLWRNARWPDSGAGEDGAPSSGETSIELADPREMLSVLWAPRKFMREVLDEDTSQQVLLLALLLRAELAVGGRSLGACEHPVAARGPGGCCWPLRKRDSRCCYLADRAELELGDDDDNRERQIHLEPSQPYRSRGASRSAIF